MKIEVYEEKPKMEEEKVLRLRLERKHGCVVVTAVDEHGDVVSCGNLITFNDNGSVVKNQSVNPDLGLPLNECQQIVFS